VRAARSFIIAVVANTVLKMALTGANAGRQMGRGAGVSLSLAAITHIGVGQIQRTSD